MAFESRDIDLPPADILNWLEGDDSRFQYLYLAGNPVFRVIELPIVQVRDFRVKAAKLSLSRTRDRFSMMNEGRG